MTIDQAKKPPRELLIEPPLARLLFNVASALLFAGATIATAMALLMPGMLQAALLALNTSSLLPDFIGQSSSANQYVLTAIGHTEIGIGLSGIRQVALLLGAVYLPVVFVLLWSCRQSIRVPTALTRPRAARLALLCLGLAAYIVLSFDVFLVGDGSAPAVVPLHVALGVFGLSFCGTIWSLPFCALPFIVRRVPSEAEASDVDSYKS